MNTELERLKGEIEACNEELLKNRERTRLLVLMLKSEICDTLLSIGLELEEANRNLKEEKRSLMEELHGLG